MEAFHEGRTSKCRGRNPNVCWKEVHTQMIKTELNEEELKQHKETLSKREEE
jgi:hypothetical protein